jgi:hypothetical protein
MKSQIFYITKGQKQSPLSGEQWEAIMQAYRGIIDNAADLEGKQEEKAVDSLEKGLKKICGKDAKAKKDSFVLHCPENVLKFAKKSKDEDYSMVYCNGLVLRLRDFLNDEILAMATNKENSRKYYVSQALQFHI